MDAINVHCARHGHNNQAIRYFCFSEDCQHQPLLCDQCLLIHNGHEFQQIAQILQFLQPHLQPQENTTEYQIIVKLNEIKQNFCQRIDQLIYISRELTFQSFCNKYGNIQDWTQELLLNLQQGILRHFNIQNNQIIARDIVQPRIDSNLELILQMLTNNPIINHQIPEFLSQIKQNLEIVNKDEFGREFGAKYIWNNNFNHDVERNFNENQNRILQINNIINSLTINQYNNQQLSRILSINKFQLREFKLNYSGNLLERLPNKNIIIFNQIDDFTRIRGIVSLELQFKFQNLNNIDRICNFIERLEQIQMLKLNFRSNYIQNTNSLREMLQTEAKRQNIQLLHLDLSSNALYPNNLIDLAIGIQHLEQLRDISLNIQQNNSNIDTIIQEISPLRYAFREMNLNCFYLNLRDSFVPQQIGGEFMSIESFYQNFDYANLSGPCCRLF